MCECMYKLKKKLVYHYCSGFRLPTTRHTPTSSSSNEVSRTWARQCPVLSCTPCRRTTTIHTYGDNTTPRRGQRICSMMFRAYHL